MKNADKNLRLRLLRSRFWSPGTHFGRSGFSSIATLTKRCRPHKAARLRSLRPRENRYERGIPYPSLRDGIRAHPTLVEV